MMFSLHAKALWLLMRNMFLESVSMGTSESVSKMSLAAIKAWETRRKNAASSSSSKNKKKNEGKKEVKKTIGRTVKEMLKQDRVKDVSSEAGLKADEAREMKALNGTALEQLAKHTQKKLDRKQAFEDAKHGSKAECKAVEVGKILKKAKIERFNGGVKVSGVQ
jgi:vacuolar-type H+-ATPase subunit I/STV1